MHNIGPYLAREIRGLHILDFAIERRGNRDVSGAPSGLRGFHRSPSHDESVTVNGLAAKSVDLVGNSPLQDSSGRVVRERDWLVTVKRRNGELMYVVFIAPDQEFSKYRPAFEQMLRSLRVK